MSEVAFNERFQTMQRWAGTPMADAGVEARKEVETITLILFLEPVCIILYSQYVCNRPLFRCDGRAGYRPVYFLVVNDQQIWSLHANMDAKRN